MNILFLTIGSIDFRAKHDIYVDLINSLRDEGCDICVVSANERRFGKQTCLYKENGITFFEVKTGNITKCNLLEKGITTLSIENVYLMNILKFLRNIKWDMILYSTPPITFYRIIKYFKKRDNAISYLMLKDIFPQNALDLGILKKKGWRRIVYDIFKAKEKSLYKISDYIGCMSPANIKFILDNNKYINPNKVGLCPNSINPSCFQSHRFNVNSGEKCVFLYGGNLGKPQGIEYMISCLSACKDINKAQFIVCGTGTELGRVVNYFNKFPQSNVTILKGLPAEEYEKLVEQADVGLIFLDYRFSIPNFPSRLLSYLDKSIPILTCTDNATDIKDIIESNNCGWSCFSNDIDAFVSKIKEICVLDKSILENKGLNGNQLLRKEYDVRVTASNIIKKYAEIRENNK